MGKIKKQAKKGAPKGVHQGGARTSSRPPAQKASVKTDKVGAPKGVPPAQKASVKTNKVGKNEKTSCADKFCPIHGFDKLKLRGRVFQGVVIRKLPGRVTIEFERILKVKKYERYEKRKTKLHARLPDCLVSEINIGDLIEIAECRPLSKMIHFVVVRRIRSKSEEGEDEYCNR